VDFFFIFLTLPSFPALAFFLATVVPQMGFVSTRPSMPDEQSEKSEKKKIQEN
jgi:hypothetical protein